MKKGVKIFLIVLVSIILLTFITSGIIYFKYFKTSNDIAVLNIKSGNVEVDQGNGWTTAKDGMDLSLNDNVRTKEGTALVVLYESIMINLKPNTEINIKKLSDENVVVKQVSGSTWNKFSNIAGIQTYKVETPTTVATVRGTGFNVEVGPNGTVIYVGEGVVDVDSESTKLSLKPNMMVIKNVGEKLVEQQINPLARIEVMKNMVQDLENMKFLRKNEILDHQDLLDKIEGEYGLSNDDVFSYLNKIDLGEIDDVELIEKSPIKLPVFTKVKKMNDKIKEQQRLILENQIQLNAPA